MANAYAILGQLLPAADAKEVLFTVPVSKQAVCSTLVIANTSDDTPAYFSVRVVKNGEQPNNAKQLILPKKGIEANGDRSLTIGITLSEGDSIYVESSTGLVSFNLFGNLIG